MAREAKDPPVKANSPEFLAAVNALPGQFGSRVGPEEQREFEIYQYGGEWAVLLELLVAVLKVRGAAITQEEYHTLGQLRDAMRLPPDLLEGLRVRADTPACRVRPSSAARSAGGGP